MLKFKYFSLILSLSFLIASCSKDNNIIATITSSPNILFIIADDLGKDAINGYQEGSIKPTTPNIDAIRNNGLLFSNFWVNPTCTPTRAAIITGKYGYHTNVKGVGDVLNSSETVIQKYIIDNTNNKYATAVVGKWHLSGNNASFNPESFGIDYYSGLIRGAVDDYYQWQLSENGGSSLQTAYTTEVFTDLAIDWMNEQSKPWFLWLAYNAPHTPFHLPPSNMHSQGSLAEYVTGVNATPYYMAAIEAMDYQIGRLLDSIPSEDRANTIIIFIGDNGTPNQVAQSPYTSSTVKNTLYQGGINVPMFISGNGVSRTGTEDNILSGTDLFATIAEIAGVSLNEYNDSKSFKSLLSQSDTIRNYQYSELNDGTTDFWTISNGTYKLILRIGNEEMYHLANDPYEQINLLNGNLSSIEQNVKLELEAELDVIRQ
ncbi:MAG: arylsulfatase B [Chitinophagales bacterium]|jgi:arylsulfatase B